MAATLYISKFKFSRQYIDNFRAISKRLTQLKDCSKPPWITSSQSGLMMHFSFANIATITQWATGSKKYSENLKLLQNAPYGSGRSKNEIWVKFEGKKFLGKFSDFFKNFQDFPYDFTLKYPKIT